MASEAEYLNRLDELWPDAQSATATLESLALSDEAVRQYPNSVALLLTRAYLLELAPLEYESVDSPRTCYERALQVDPNNAEAWESFGFYLDALEDR